MGHPDDYFGAKNPYAITLATTNTYYYNKNILKKLQ
jgi:hypothetical protein